MQPYPKVLLLGSDEDWFALEELLAQHAVVTGVRSVSEALAELAKEDYDVLFCQRNTATWRTVLAELRNRRAELPVIVFCHSGGEGEWVEALEAGAFDLLAPPYNHDRIVAALESALASQSRLVAVAE
jgi:DNA-binding NtrC family response regulator